MKPLKGITVIDLSRLLPGGFASTLLLELGARVIKVEQPGVGDYYRAVKNPEGVRGVDDLTGGRQVDILNNGKESLGLNLKSEEGLVLFKKLVKKADVVIENFRPGVLKKIGLGYPVLKKINPRIILCSITGAGQTGPLSHLAGHDLNYLAACGLLTKIRDAQGRLVIPDFQIIDLASAMEAVNRIEAALLQRYLKKTKKPQGVWLDCSMTEAGRSLARLYSRRTDRFFLGDGLLRYGIYETSDKKHMAFAPLEPKFWDKFCQRIGHPDWSQEMGPFQFEDPQKHETLRKIFKSKSFKEWTRIADEDDVCLSPVEEVPEPPIQSAPPLGQHTNKILRSLGYSPSQIRFLKKQNVVQ